MALNYVNITEVNMTAMIEPRLVNDRLSGHLKNITIAIKEKESRIGHFSDR